MSVAAAAAGESPTRPMSRAVMMEKAMKRDATARIWSPRTIACEKECVANLPDFPGIGQNVQAVLRGYLSLMRYGLRARVLAWGTHDGVGGWPADCWPP